MSEASPTPCIIVLCNQGFIHPWGWGRRECLNSPSQTSKSATSNSTFGKKFLDETLATCLVRGGTNASHRVCTNMSIFITFGMDLCVMSRTHCIFTYIANPYPTLVCERLILGGGAVLWVIDTSVQTTGWWRRLSSVGILEYSYKVEVTQEERSNQAK